MALIHRWPLTANATDVVGGLATTNNGNVTFDATNGASFNGSTQYLSFTKNLSSMSFTLSVWAKFTTFNSYPSLFMADNASSSTPTGLMYYSGTAARGYYNASYYATSSSSEFNSTNYPPTSFVLCTMVYDNVASTIKVYRGATLVASINSAVVSSTLSASFSLGRRGAVLSSNYFKGSMLDARIYDSALTGSDVTALNSAGPQGGDTAKYFPQCV